MSYCVNCGVELAASERVCALCGVEVLNPAKPWQEPKARPYPSRVDKIIYHVDRKYTASLISLLLLIPAGVCLVGDLFSDGGISWSLYVIAGLVTLFVATLLPLILKKHPAYLLIFYDVLAVLALLLLIQLLGGGKPWFYGVGVPLTLLLGGIIELLAIWFEKPRQVLVSAALTLLAAGSYVVLLEVALNRYMGVLLAPRWSWYAFIPCAVTGVFLLILNRRRKWKESVYKRMFF